MKYLIMAACLLIPAISERKVVTGESYYVKANELSVRLGPRITAKKTNTLYKDNKVNVLEVKDGWARISRYYDGILEGESGKVARWVSADYLSNSKQIKKVESAELSPIEKALKQSDNYSSKKAAFIKASEKLINERKCSLKDFKDAGGWVRSSTHKPKSVYFVYCGGYTKRNRIYLDSVSGRIFK